MPTVTLPDDLLVSLNGLADEQAATVGDVLRQLLNQRTQAERPNQRHTETTLRALLDVTHQSFVFIAPDFMVIELNKVAQRDLYNTFGKAAAPGMDIRDFVPERDWTTFHTNFQTALDGQPVCTEKLFADTNENERYYELLYKAVLDESGQPLGVCLMATDITARRLAGQHHMALTIERDRNQLLRKFITDVSHDLRTSVTVIGSSAYLLGRSPLNDAQLKRVQKIEHQSIRLKNMLDDMYDLMLLEQRSTLELHVEDINALLDQVIDKQRRALEAKGHTLTFHRCPDGLPVIGDTDKIEKALGSILTNAVRFTPDGGTITLTTQCDDQSTAIIEISDNGIGISANDLPRIFESFYRADETRSIETGGGGLGLSLTKRIIEIHGGSITVDSELGVGSTFRVFLPCYLTGSGDSYSITPLHPSDNF